MAAGSSDYADTRLSRGSTGSLTARGRVCSFTCVQEVPEEFTEQAPYYLALVELDDGGNITAQLTDVDKPLKIGDPVEMVTRKLSTDGSRGIIIYGYKFRPLLEI